MVEQMVNEFYWHVNVCVWELTEVLGQLSAPVDAHHTLVIHVTLVSHKQHLRVVPWVGLNLSRPVNTHTRAHTHTYEHNKLHAKCKILYLNFKTKHWF